MGYAWLLQSAGTIAPAHVLAYAGRPDSDGVDKPSLSLTN
jgi:hypothetical protein